MKEAKAYSKTNKPNNKQTKGEERMKTRRYTIIVEDVVHDPEEGFVPEDGVDQFLSEMIADGNYKVVSIEDTVEVEVES